jgi:hypothetical protein
MTSGTKELRPSHPFFWAGYLLVDCQPRADAAPAAEPKKDKEGDKKEEKAAGEGKGEEARPDSEKP